jgi:hypothetical protein
LNQVRVSVIERIGATARRFRHTLLSGDRAALLLVVSWPFLFLWPYTLRQVSIGNDFFFLYWQYKAYFLASMTDGHFPLWSPTESAGYPFYSNPFAQPFYPLNVVYLLFYTLRGHFSSWHYTLFTIMALSIFGAGLLTWLRLLGVPRHITCAAAIVALMSLKITETLRFPNAAHSAAWMPWLLLGITLAARRRHLVAGCLVFAGATLMLLTAGYPYYVIYAIFLVGPYALAMLFPATRTAFLDVPKEQQTASLTLLSAMAIAFAAPAALAFPWLKHVGALLSQTVDRAAPVFAFATAHRFTLQSTIGSWIFPPAAPMEGWYYFGVATTLLIGSYFCCVMVGRGVAARHRRIALMVLVWGLLVTYFTWGADSILFTAVWHHVPVLDQMRVWGRLNIVLIPALALLLAFALQHFLLLLENARKRPAGARIFVTALAVLSIGIFAAQVYMAATRIFDEYWGTYFKSPSVNWSNASGLAQLLSYPFNENYFAAMTVLSAGSLFALWLLALRRLSPIRPAPVVASVIALSVVDLFYVANFQWAFPFYHVDVARISASGLVNAGFGKPRRLAGNTVDPVGYAHNVGVLDNWNFMRHANIFGRFFDAHGEPQPGVPPAEIAAARRLYGADERAQRIFFTSHIDFNSPGDFIADVDATTDRGHAAAIIEFYDGDVLRLKVRTAESVWLSVIDNWDPNWHATIDGREVAMTLLFRSYKSVYLDVPGEHAITFSYRPSLLP